MLKKLKELNPSKATGLDNIPTRFLRDAADSLTPCIMHMVNLSITLGMYPNEFKQVRDIPFYKKVSHIQIRNTCVYLL